MLALTCGPQHATTLSLLPSLPLALSISLPPCLSLSYRREHKLQQVNLHWKRVWWEEGKAFVKLRLSAKAIKALKTKVCTVCRERKHARCSRMHRYTVCTM